MSLHDSLEADLKAISAEGRRKSGQIKDLAEKAVIDLRKSPIVPSDSIIQVMESVKGVGTGKIYLHVISILQKLLTHHLIDSISVISILEFLASVIVETTDESLQLKSLQTIMLVLDPSVVILTEDLVSIVWNICINLHAIPSGLVRNTASAALRQLINITFEKRNECKDRTDSFEGKAVNDSSCILFKYVIELVSGTHSHWKGEKFRMKSEGVNLLSSILSIKDILSSFPADWLLALNSASTTMQASVSDYPDESYTVTCISCITKISQFSQEFSILQILSTFLNTKSCSDLIKLTVLESFSHVLKKPMKILKITQTAELGKVLESISAVDTGNNEESKPAKMKNKILIEIVGNLNEMLVQGCAEAGITLGEAVVVDKDVEKVIAVVWKSALAILIKLTTAPLSETQQQAVLNSYQTLVNLTGSLNIIQGREAIISALSAFAKPSIQLTQKQLSCYKTLLNIAHGLHCVLDMKSWHRILFSLQLLDNYLHCNKSDDELQILQSALENLFLATSKWPITSTEQIIRALGQLTLEFMETLSLGDKKLSICNIFALDKLLIVTNENLSRVVCIWDNVKAFLDCICNSKSSEIRVIGIGRLTSLVIKIFKLFIESPPECEPGSKWDDWQRTLFASFHDFSNQQDQEVYKGVNMILQSCGGQLNIGGWSAILSILKEIDMNSYTALAFKCLHLIINDFLQSEELLKCLSSLVALISKFAYSNDIKQGISAVGMYWNIVDHLGRVGKEDEESWWVILCKLRELGQDGRPEVRHSAIHSLNVALSTHGSCLPQSLWQRIMENVILLLLQRISATYFKYATVAQEVPILEPEGFNEPELNQSPMRKGKMKLQISIPTDLAHPLVSETPKFAGKIEMPKEDKIIIHHSRDTLEKQWEETYNIFTQNLGKLFRTYLANLENSDEVEINGNIKKNWDLLILRLKEGLHHGTTNIITAVLKAVKELISCNKVTALFFAKWNSSWEIFTTLSNRLQVSNVSIPHKLILVIIEDLSLIYQSEYKEPYLDKSLQNLYLLLNSLLGATKLEPTLSNCRITQEQKEVFEFLEAFSEGLIKKEVSLVAYLKFLMKFCVYDAQDSHSDALCRRALQGIETVAWKNPISLSPVINELFTVIEALVVLRYNSESLLLMSVTCKGSELLYYVAGESFLRILKHFTSIYFWDKLLDVFEKILLPETALLNSINQSSLNEMMRNSERLDIKLIAFLQHSIISPEMSGKTSLQLRIINFIGKCHGNHYKCYPVLDREESFPAFCLSALFNLSGLSDNHIEIAKIAAPVLINLCKELLISFVNEEKSMGILPMSRPKELELIALLNLIKNLEIYEGVLERRSKKPQLIELFLNLSDLIICKEPEIKETLREVFIEAYKEFV